MTMDLLAVCFTLLLCHVCDSQPKPGTESPMTSLKQLTYTPDTLHLTTTFNYSLQTPQQTSVSTNNTETDTSLFQEESGNLSLVLSTTEAVGNVTEIPQQDALDDNDQVMYVNNLTETASKKVVENSNKNDTEEKCSGYLPDESNAHQFQVFAFERWVTQKCHYGLIWNQDLCQCDWAPGHQFFSPTEEGGCDLTLNITFDESIIRDYAKNAFISVEQKVEIRPANRNEREDSVSGYFHPGLLRILFFAGNSYSNHLKIEFYFKRIELATNSTEMVILSNACYDSESNISESTLSLTLFPKIDVIGFAINEHYEEGQVNLEAEIWHQVNITITKGNVVINMDGQEVLKSHMFPEYIQNSQCPLTIGGDPTKQSFFYGYIDDILLWRQCSPN
ncbi:uncharacterized protein LOC118766613 [Octopus sinensis]|uniref:Uncharacterized protein LOC118766613 n=1 Tax=Octopus sinensis TaxID=2607531 RepID=A0A7E6FE95_9MOLL|nr:uncharacterized protein LOC118766613 [Octopus sinensis]